MFFITSNIKSLIQALTFSLVNSRKNDFEDVYKTFILFNKGLEQWSKECYTVDAQIKFTLTH